jgi:hypothetical protein
MLAGCAAALPAARDRQAIATPMSALMPGLRAADQYPPPAIGYAAATLFEIDFVAYSDAGSFR